MGYLGSYDDLCCCDIYNYVTKQFMEDYDWQESFALTCGTKEQQDYYKNLFEDKFNKKNMGAKDIDIISAAHAHKMTDDIRDKDIECLEPIMKKIKEAIAKKDYHCYISSMEDYVKKKLINLGYNVDYIPGDPRDPRECSMYKISW